MKILFSSSPSHVKPILQSQVNPFAIGRILLLVIVLVSSFIRIGLLDVPLERDEGEYAYAGQLILNGIAPYDQIYNMKLPGIYAAYALILAIFGQTHTGIHLGLLVINAFTIVFIYLLAESIFTQSAGVIAASIYSALSLCQSVQGVFANAEHFVVLPIVIGGFLLWRALEKGHPWKLFFSGFFFGVGFLMKQHGAVFIAFGGLYTLTYGWKKTGLNWRIMIIRCILFSMGALLPYGITCLVFFSIGLFTNFWFWTVEYAKSYVSLTSVDSAWFRFTSQFTPVIKSSPFVWIAAGLGFFGLLWNDYFNNKRAFILLFSVFSFIAICPGFYFRPHYFVLTIPAAALLVATFTGGLTHLAFKYKSNRIVRSIPIMIGLICIGSTLYIQRNYLFYMNPLQVSRSTYGLNPFPESIKISQYIQSVTEASDHIAIIGSEPQIYFYSKRRSASGYVYMYPLMEKHEYALQMQNEMISEVEKAKPEIIIFVNVSTSWLKQAESHEKIFVWFQAYQASKYTPMCLVEIFPWRSHYSYAPNITRPSHFSNWILIFKRNDFDAENHHPANHMAREYSAKRSI